MRPLSKDPRRTAWIWMPSVPAIPRPRPTAPCHARLAMTLQVGRTPIPPCGPPSPPTRRKGRSSGECPAWLLCPIASGSSRGYFEVLSMSGPRYYSQWSDEGVICTRHASKSSTYIGRLCLFRGRLRPATALRCAAGRYRRCKAPATVTHLQPETNTRRGPMRQTTVPCGRWLKDT